MSGAEGELLCSQVSKILECILPWVFNTVILQELVSLRGKGPFLIAVYVILYDSEGWFGRKLLTKRDKSY